MNRAKTSPHLCLAVILPLLTAVLMALSGCDAARLAASAADTVSTPPAPMERTVIDEKAITLAAQAVDAAALSANALVRAGLIRPGGQTAIKLAMALDAARDGVNAAEAARRAGSAASYAQAMDHARAAIAEIKAIIATFSDTNGDA